MLKNVTTQKGTAIFSERDTPCVNIGGTCQDDIEPCCGGYQSLLCGGGVNRRCCKGKFLLKHPKQHNFHSFCSSREKSDFLDCITPKL